jgi:hypothetical protein
VPKPKRKRSTRALSSPNGGDNDFDDENEEHEDEENGIHENNKVNFGRTSQRKFRSSSSLKSNSNDGNDDDGNEEKTTNDSPSLKRKRDLPERVTKTKKIKRYVIFEDSDNVESLSSSNKDGSDD